MHKYYEIEDLDDKVNGYDWYVYGMTNKSIVYLDMLLVAYDENNKRITPYNKTQIRTFSGEEYYDSTDMKEGVYEAYKYGYGNKIISGIYNDVVRLIQMI